jgi:phosphatidate cytidylyltransferase
MLKQRVITAIVLLLVLLPAMFYSDPGPFCAISIVMIATGAWEWAKLNGYSKSISLICGIVCAGVCVAIWRLGALEQSTPQLWRIAGALWVLVGAWVLRGGVVAWSVHRPVIRLLSGLVALSLAWLAVAQAKIIGTNYLLSILVLVWAADIGAYFAGRSLGGRFIHRKLAPGISPGKSWEGVIGGMAGVLVLAFLWRWADAAS